MHGNVVTRILAAALVQAGLCELFGRGIDLVVGASDSLAGLPVLLLYALASILTTAPPTIIAVCLFRPNKASHGWFGAALGSTLSAVVLFLRVRATPEELRLFSSATVLATAGFGIVFAIATAAITIFLRGKSRRAIV